MSCEDKKPLLLCLTSALIGAGVSWVLLKQLQKHTNKPLSQQPKKDSNLDEIKITEEEATLMKEQCKRNIQFLGEEEFIKLRNSKVVIIGVGGVGSHAASLLARTGVSKLRLIDLDQVSLSSLNRHAVATREDVGRSKVLVLKNHLLKVVPSLQCETIQDIFTEENGRRLLLSEDPLNENCTNEIIPDFVVDCIDNVETKAFLLAFCLQNNINVITTCGSGCRADPTRFTICDISETYGDPLLRATKLILNKKYRIRDGINCLFSNEPPPRKLLPFAEAEDANPLDYQQLPDIHLRVRIVPVLGPMPALWGNTIAQYVIIKLTGLEFIPNPTESRGRKYWDSFIQRIRKSEKKNGFKDVVRVGIEDIKYIIEDTWNYQSVLSGKPPTSALTCVRFDKSQPLSVYNMLPLTEKEARTYYTSDDKDFWSEYMPTIRAKMRHFVSL